MWSQVLSVPKPKLRFWPDEVNFHLAETVVRENEAVEDFELPAEPPLDVPTRLLTGERGPEQLKAAINAFDERVPHARVVELDGVGHVATDTAPGAVADVIREFDDEA